MNISLDSRYLVKNLSCPMAVMNFYLVYSGKLPASGNSSKKPDAVRDIRDKLHPQLKLLWETHAALKRLKWSAIVPPPEAFDNLMITPPDSPFLDVDEPPTATNIPEGFINLLEPIAKGKKTYVPLVRKSLDLVCSMSILFLRQEDPGELVSQGGDLDGRIKTLFDALRAPDEDVELKYPQAQDETYCLLENDTLISKFDVTSGRLLFPQSTHHHEVHIVIDVKVHVLTVGSWNIALTGA